MYLLHDLLTEQARVAPERVAVSYGQQSLTYGELERQSSALAVTLGAQGVCRGDRVGIMLEKSAEAIVSIFGILKVGAAYMPLDPMLPPVRLASMMERCEVRCLVCSTKEIAKFRQSDQGLRISSIVLVEPSVTTRDDSPNGASCVSWLDAVSPSSAHQPVWISDQSPAYILHTSGSTGVPKAVVISHLNALSFVKMAKKFFAINSSDRVGSVASLSFDLSVFDIFCAVMAGATIVLIPASLTAFPAKLSEFVDRERISIWNSVASLLSMMADRGKLDRFGFESLRLVHFSGDIMPAKSLRTLKAHMRRASFFNIYGQTEANSSLYFAIGDIPDNDAWRIPIGIPFPNFDVFALDSEGRGVDKPGQEGELYVCSATVALGYWRSEEATRQRFVSDPRDASWRTCVYKTGDLVRLDEGGNFVFVGRADTMVKVRGYRVELSEIELALCGSPNISEAVAIVVPDGGTGSRIAAYVSPVPGTQVGEQELKSHCARILPPYMVPDEIQIVSEFPRTATGKADRKAIAISHVNSGFASRQN
jgi:amino acid adenylation domain-containing protein